MNIVACMMLTTNNPARQEDRRLAIEALEYAVGNIYSRILAVDVLPGCPQVVCPGWRISMGPGRGMAHNMATGLSCVEDEILLYCEDHAFINRFPSPHALNEIFDVEMYGKKLGYICYNTHVLDAEKPDPGGRFLKFVQNPSEYVNLSGEVFLIKNAQIQDMWYVNFPVAIVRTDVFRRMLTWILENCKGKGVEASFTAAWFALGLDKQYHTAIYVRPEIQPEQIKSVQDLHQFACMRFVDNDLELLARKKTTTSSNKGKLVQ